MAAFTDSTGHRWRVRISLAVLRRIEDETRLPILACLGDRQRLKDEVLGRAGHVARALYYAVYDDALRRNVAYEEFERLVSGGSVGQATRALYEALLECFPISQPARAPTLPETLTEYEIRERWAEWEKRHGDA